MNTRRMMQLIRRLTAVAIAIVAVVLFSSCAETTRPKATGKGAIRGINAVVSAPELSFAIEERSLGNVRYKEVAGFSEYDDLTYNFNFDLLLPGATDAQRIATQLVDVAADTEYTLVLTGTLNNPSIIMWEDAEREWAGTETVFESAFVHLSPQLGEVDIYFATAGTVPVLGNEVGTLNNGERLPIQEFPNDQYELIITAPDDALNILYQSQPISSTPATRVTFALFDPDPSITAPLGVNLINSGGGSSGLSDVNSPPQLRLLHAAFGTASVDAFYDGDFANKIFPDIEFGELSAYADLQGATALVTLTPVGDTTSTVFENTLFIAPNSYSTAVLAGAPGALSYNVLLDDARPLSTFPVIRISNMSVNTEFLDVYILEPGAPIDADTLPRWSFLPSPADTSYFAAEAGMYELTATIGGEKTAISTPLALDIAASDVVDIVILDTADPAVVEMRVFDSNQP